MPTFEDLRIWQTSHQLMEKIFKLCKNLPRDERFRLRGQIERSSSSVCDNIAEGYSAYYYGTLNLLTQHLLICFIRICPV